MALKGLGTVNGFFAGTFTIGGKPEKVRYPGTTLGLTLAAVDAGAKVGDRLTCDMGIAYRLAATGGGDRTPGGVWARREWGA